MRVFPAWNQPCSIFPLITIKVCVSRPKNAQPNHSANPNKTSTARTTAPGFSFPDGMTHTTPISRVVSLQSYLIRRYGWSMCVSNIVIKSIQGGNPDHLPSTYVCSSDAKGNKVHQCRDLRGGWLHSKIPIILLFFGSWLGRETFSPPLYISLGPSLPPSSQEKLYTHIERG